MTETRPFPPVLLLLALASMLGLHFAWPVPLHVGSTWQLAGGVMAMAGLALNVSASELFRRRGTPVRPFKEPSELVVDGAYRFTRNPMYLGMTLELIGVAFALGSRTPFVVAPAFVFVIRQRFVLAEEGILARRFGPQYKGYCVRVRRWV